MKALTILLCALCVSCAAPVIFTGCAAPVSERTAAYKSLAAVGHAVDAAMRTYASAVAMNAVSAEQQQRVRDLHGRYQPAFAAAVAAAQYDFAAAPPESLAALAAELTALVIQLTRNS